MDERTAFPTASVLKLLTAVAVLQLAERGRLELGAPIQKYCSQYPPKRWPVTPRLLLVWTATQLASTVLDVPSPAATVCG